MLQDVYYDKLKDALEESRHRRSSPVGKGMITHVGESPYGGYRVTSMPAEFYVDLLVDGMIRPPRRGMFLR